MCREGWVCKRASLARVGTVGWERRYPGRATGAQGVTAQRPFRSGVYERVSLTRRFAGMRPPGARPERWGVVWVWLAVVSEGTETRQEGAVEEHGEVCLQEEIGRLLDRGLSEDEIARRMGVDPGWVSSVVAMLAPEAAGHGSGEG